MSDSSWDKVYSQKGMAAYPDNMLIRFVAKHYYNFSNRKDVKFLDVGCGAGASAWYLAREGFSVAAIDNSAVAMERLRVRLEKEKLEALMLCGDITELPLKKDFFDCIIDISSVCYIHKSKLEPLMKELHKVLKPGGRFFSITPTFNCSKEPFNKTIDDVKLNARFQSQKEAVRNFKDFKDVIVKRAMYDVEHNSKWQSVSVWVIEAVK